MQRNISPHPYISDLSFRYLSIQAPDPGSKIENTKSYHGYMMKDDSFRLEGLTSIFWEVIYQCDCCRQAAYRMALPAGWLSKITGLRFLPSSKPESLDNFRGNVFPDAWYVLRLLSIKLGLRLFCSAEMNWWYNGNGYFRPIVNLEHSQTHEMGIYFDVNEQKFSKLLLLQATHIMVAHV